MTKFMLISSDNALATIRFRVIVLSVLSRYSGFLVFELGRPFFLTDIAN